LQYHHNDWVIRMEQRYLRMCCSCCVYVSSSWRK